MDRSQRPFVVLLLVALAATLWLVRPYLDAVLVAGVVAILVWPFHLWVHRRLGEREGLAVSATMIALVVGVFAPAATLALFVAREVVGLANELVAQVEFGSWNSFIQRVSRAGPLKWLTDALGGRTAFVETVENALRQGTLSVASSVTQNVPGLLSVTAGVVLKVVIFLVALATLLRRGPELLVFGRRIAPIEPRHVERLYAVFQEFARNVVLAGLVAGVLQGLTATLGYTLAGVERSLLFGVLTGVFAYVPLIGTTFIWVPVVVLLLAEHRTGAALFVAVWSIALTGTVDNLVKPFIVRGRSDVPMLLVFLGVFGGLAWFGFIGILVGPVLVAMMLALLKIWAEIRGGDEAPAGPQ